jgi:protein NrfD
MTAIAPPAVPEPAVPTAATVRPIRPRLERAAWIATAIACAAGIVGLIWRFAGGHQAADYGSYVPWGLWIAAYIALVGASAGAFAFAALVFVQRRTAHYEIAVLAMLVALGAFMAGMANVWLDLGHPFRAWKLLLDTSFSSVMGLMAWFYGVYAVVLLVGLWAVRKGTVPRFVERWAWLAFVFAVVFAGSEGALFGVVGAQPTWESGLTPVLFLVEAALFGLSLVVAAGALFGLLDTRLARRLGYALLALLGVLVVIEWSEFTTGLLASVPAKEEALRAILFGDFWWVFWFLHIGLGIVVPAVILLVGRWHPAPVGIAGALIAAMSLASKLNLVVPALAQEEIDGLTAAFTGPGLTNDYFPSAMEWLVLLGTVGLAALVVLVGRRLILRSWTDADARDISASTQGTT